MNMSTSFYFLKRPILQIDFFFKIRIHQNVSGQASKSFIEKTCINDGEAVEEFLATLSYNKTIVR